MKRIYFNDSHFSCNAHLLLCCTRIGTGTTKDTPLHIALRNDQVNKDAIVMMINAFPNILSISNKEGLMPLHICCRYCSNRSDIIDFIARSYPKACMIHIKVRVMSYELRVTMYIQSCLHFCSFLCFFPISSIFFLYICGMNCNENHFHIVSTKLIDSFFLFMICDYNYNCK
jgi:hypothetical protein